ncbi:pilus assembly protein PilP [bacterium]|nr:pilus assembly protein PilP [bacterium]
MRSVDRPASGLLLAALCALAGALPALAETPAPATPSALAPPEEVFPLQRFDLRTVPYEASLARDPFALPDYAVGTKRSSAELDLRSAVLVGIVRLRDGGYIALVEDENGDSYALTKGDPIDEGQVVAIDEAALIAWMRNGDSRQQVRLELAKEGE